MTIHNKRVWDRSKQTYFIARRGNPWKVVSFDGTREICDYPAFLYNADLEEAVCFAADDDAVKKAVEAHRAKKEADGSSQ